MEPSKSPLSKNDMEKSQESKNSFLKKNRPKVLFFDVNETLLDLTPLKKKVGKALDGKENLVTLWFTTLLQYSLVTSASGQYEHFGNIGAATLTMVAANHNITISAEEAKLIVTPTIRNLQPHPEVKDALSQLKSDDYKLVAFTNSSIEGLKEQMKNAGLTSYFDKLLSVENAGKFKPFMESYNWAAHTMGIKPEESMMIAAHGWDVAGALWAGWRAAFVSRPGHRQFPLAPKTEIEAPDLQKIADLLMTYKND
jgi:2-haloacid dehalogenase